MEDTPYQVKISAAYDFFRYVSTKCKMQKCLQQI